MAAVVYRVEDPLEQLQLRLRIRQLQHGRSDEAPSASRPRLGQTCVASFNEASLTVG
jgi:plasmid stability protein